MKHKVQLAQFEVALRKESVDRNVGGNGSIQHIYKSLSARRAWIEISLSMKNAPRIDVALRKESVDRNFLLLRYFLEQIRRSPQGERG